MIGEAITDVFFNQCLLLETGKKYGILVRKFYNLVQPIEEKGCKVLRKCNRKALTVDVLLKMKDI